MINKPVYIHYGDDTFRIPHPIVNRQFFTKPRGGLWASRKDGDMTWKDWCESEEFHLDRLNMSFEFTLKDDARILTLSDPEQLLDLPKTPYLDPVRWPCECLSVYLDFEKLKEQYDAIELTNICGFYWSLYGWDCNSILIMNPDIVEVVSNEREEI